MAFEDGPIVESRASDDCFIVAAVAGRLIVTPQDPEDDETVTFEVAALTCGASLLQRLDTNAEPGAETCLLVIGFPRSDAIAVLDEPALTPAIAAAASDAGVKRYSVVRSAAVARDLEAIFDSSAGKLRRARRQPGRRLGAGRRAYTDY